MEELPTAGNQHHLSLRRIPAFRDHLQRIKDGRFYNHTSEQQRVFLIEIPLSELVAWDAIRGADLAQRASRNTLRYQELFCTVLDETLANLVAASSSSSSSSNTNNNHEGDGGNVLNSIDVLNQHRLAIQQATIREQEAQRAAAAARQGDGVHNPYAGRGQVQDDGDENNDGNGNNNNKNATNATEEIPAVLLRRYELRILPLGRRGTLPPFAQQHIPKQATTNADSSWASASWPPPPEALSLRAIRSNCLGRLVSVRGMIVRTSKVQPCTVVATYSCDACGDEIYQPVSTREFMPPRSCE
jgi:DNA replicative helicase MCM subunit Mcm2 (Cdc46/Mcm family)